MIGIHKKAIMKADEVRTRLGLDMFQPINIFDSCTNMGIAVRFVDINMEGLYIKQKNNINPTIILSNQRPLPRRCFTCAHELGHHIFDHGMKLDVLSEAHVKNDYNDSDEYLVDSFAGSLLMPLAGVQAEFAKRGWVIKNCSPTDFYTISSVFGVGYQTLVFHCKTNNLINDQKAKDLLKLQPGKILEVLLGKPVKDKSYFKIVDNYWRQTVIDLEVANYVVLPSNFCVDGYFLSRVENIHEKSMVVYIVKKPGIFNVISKDNTLSCFVRIQNSGYVGLAEYRHLESEENQN